MHSSSAHSWTESEPSLPRAVNRAQSSSIESEEETEEGRLMNEADIDGDGKISPAEALAAALRELGKWNPIYLACFISLSVIPPLLGLQIIKPCFECYDFEAAALHEIGHFLGFGHPDNIPVSHVGKSVST